MKPRHKRLVSAISLVGVIVAAAAAFTAESRKIMPVNPSNVPGRIQSAPGGGQVTPLKGEIRLAPGGQRFVGGQPVMAKVTFDQLNQKFTEFSGHAKKYELGVKWLPEVAKHCANKPYSVQDQMAAGCTGNDTLNQCMDKLYKHCVQTATAAFVPSVGIGGGGGQVGISTKDFLQSAQVASANARALSQLLTQYANDVDQNSKALVP